MDVLIRWTLNAVQVIAFIMGAVALFNLIDPWLATLIISVIVLVLSMGIEGMLTDDEENEHAE